MTGRRNLVVLGGGPGGYVAALRAAIAGASVTVVERGSLGGTCLNAGCIPTKAMLASTDVLDAVRNSCSFGVAAAGDAYLDLPAAAARKEKIVAQLVRGIEALFAAHHVERLRGEGVVQPDGTVSFATAGGETRLLAPEHLILATGSLPVVPALFPYDGASIITSDEALKLQRPPASMIVVGGGVIGCELGQFFAKCGTKVTIIESMPQLLPSEDPDVSEVLARAFRKAKISVRTGQKIVRCERTACGAWVRMEDGTEIQAEKLLVCVGRMANTAQIPLDALGIAHKDGKLLVDAQMQTTHEGIYAIGDIVASPMLAHVASREGMVAAQNICGIPTTMSYRAVPRCVYTAPEIAAVGMTERQLQMAGRDYRTGCFQFLGLGKAKAAGKTEGFVKVIADEQDVLVGACIAGAHATELLSELTLAVELGLTARCLEQVIHPHPTMGEAVMEAIHQLHGVCVHAMPGAFLEKKS